MGEVVLPQAVKKKVQSNSKEQELYFLPKLNLLHVIYKWNVFQMHMYSNLKITNSYRHILQRCSK